MSGENTARAAEEILQRAKKRLGQLEAAGLDTGSIRKKLARAKDLYGKKQYAAVVRTGEDILVVTKIALEEVQTTLARHVGKGKGNSEVMQQVERTVSKVAREEIDKFAHSKTLRAMFESIAREEAEEQVNSLRQTVVEIDSRGEHLLAEMDTKAETSRLASLETTVGDQLADCATVDELEAQIAALKKELAQAREEARKKLATDVKQDQESARAKLEKKLAQAQESDRVKLDKKLAALPTAADVDSKIAAFGKNLDTRLSSMPTAGQVKKIVADAIVPLESGISAAASGQSAAQRALDQRITSLQSTVDKKLTASQAAIDDALTVARTSLDKQLAALKKEVDDKLSSGPRLTAGDVKQIVREMSPKAKMLTRADVQEIVNDSISERSSNEDIDAKLAVVREQVEARFSSVPSPDDIEKLIAATLAPLEASIASATGSLASAQAAVDDKFTTLRKQVDKTLSSIPGLTREDVKLIAREMVVSKAEGLTKDQVRQIVNDNVADLAGPENVDAKIAAFKQELEGRLSSILSVAQVEDLIAGTLSPLQSAISSAENGLSATQKTVDEKLAVLRQEVDHKLSSIPKVTKKDVKLIAREMTPKVKPVTKDQIEKMVEGKASELVTTKQFDSRFDTFKKEVEEKLSSVVSTKDVEKIVTGTISPLESAIATAATGVSSSQETVDKTVAALKKEIDKKLSSAPKLTEADVRRIAKEVVPAATEIPVIEAPSSVSPEEMSKMASRKVLDVLRTVRAELAKKWDQGSAPAKSGKSSKKKQ